MHFDYQIEEAKSKILPKDQKMGLGGALGFSLAHAFGISLKDLTKLDLKRVTNRF